tara:strand:- start:18920 stop:19375 length:456 start_codon:yes stop_codon:yes gene_type:complete
MAKKSNNCFNTLDKDITHWMQVHGVSFLQYSLAMVFIWFGLLKPLGLSPAQGLVANTVYWFDPSWFVPFLGWWEVLIGVCFLFRPLIRLGIGLMALQMAGTLLPLVLLPEVVYGPVFGWTLTLEGQYIVKNVVLIAAAIVVGSHVRDKVKK